MLPPALVSAVQGVFSALPQGRVTAATAGGLCAVLGLPALLAGPLLRCVYGAEAAGGCGGLLSYWQQHSRQLVGEGASDRTRAEARLLHLLRGATPGPPAPQSLTRAQLAPLAEELVATHPQLEFFRQGGSSGLHAAYTDAVVASLLWEAGGWSRGVIDRRQLASLDLPTILAMLEDPDQDLNLVPHFSYDQFYVLYVKFVQLQAGEGAGLGVEDVLDFEGGGQLTRALVERLFLRHLHPTTSMAFPDFCHLVLALVDTASASSLAYWFAVLDTDHDGFLGLGELEGWYGEAVELLASCGVGVAVVPWRHLAVQLLDTTGPPAHPAGWSRHQLAANARSPTSQSSPRSLAPLSSFTSSHTFTTSSPGSPTSSTPSSTSSGSCWRTRVTWW